MKDINYEIKATSARTTYYDISKHDMDYIIGELLRYQSLMGELSKSKDKKIQEIVKTLWRDNNKQLPIGKNGMNSPESFVAGMLNNILYGNQYNISDVQAHAIQLISEYMEIVYEHVVGKNYQPNMPAMEQMKFRESLIEWI